MSNDTQAILRECMQKVCAKDTLVYRIEHPKGHGPYINNATPGWQQRSHSSWDTHPSPAEEQSVSAWRNAVEDKGCYPSDIKLMEMMWELEQLKLEVLCAFANADKLTQWFDEGELTRLSFLGFKVRCYRVPVAYHLTRQSLFFQHTGKLVSEHDPLEFTCQVAVA